MIDAVHGGLGGLHRVALVEDRRGRAGEVVDLVDLDVQRKRDVVTHQLEVRVGQHRQDVGLAARVEVVDAQHLVALTEQAPAQVRPDEARAAGDEDLAHCTTSASTMRRASSGARVWAFQSTRVTWAFARRAGTPVLHLN